MDRMISRALVARMFGLSEAVWLHDQIAKIWSSEHYDCADNFRLALVGDKLSEEAFDEACNDGCCGATHFEIGPSPHGKKYRYGFNYGH